MSDSAATDKALKMKKVVPRKKQEGPWLGELLLKIVVESGDRKGISLQAIKKMLWSKGLDVDKLGTQIKQSVRRNVDKDTLA
ncbi:hypothetical protein scyTo_0006086 [Scyliorhinus torazame]|uniref:H15 domain-containing protein n=1 Tax=Scyliorhinus torazame TaxID=75743 RepID=A0A401PFF0_SCYTO|nr:hypothetical protein [Scyliorhinus torazame]